MSGKEAANTRMKPAKQARSERTLQRLMDAAELVLRVKSFKEAGVVEIAKQAGVTVGALYFRFADKDALLDQLEERWYADFGNQVGEVFLPLEKGEQFDTRMSVALEKLATFYIAHRGVARAVSERARTDRASDSRRARRNAALFDRACAWIEESFPPARKAGRERVNTALLFVTTALRERTLFLDFWPGGVPDTRELCRELGAAMTDYLRGSAEREKFGKFRSDDRA